MHSDHDPFVATPTRQPPTPPIFLRDFAYPQGARVVLTERSRMASERSIAKILARDFAELLSGPMVDVYVGRERKLWSLHRNLLCHHSPYFETELLGHEVPKKQNGEGSQKLELPEDDARGFELFVKWLYQGQLDDISELHNDHKYEYAVACHKLYLLSSKFSMPHLSNVAMDTYRQCLHETHLVPDADEINEIYRSSPPKSPFRRLMTKIAARQIMDPEVDKDAESYRAAFDDNPDFAVEMVNAIRYMSGGMLFENPTDGGECDWHDHSDGGDCQGRRLGKAKGKGGVPYMNGVSGMGPLRHTGTTRDGNTSSQIEGTNSNQRLHSPTLTRVRSTPLAELPVDKRTPRKLNLPPQQPATRPGAQQTSTTRGKGRVVSTPLQNATGVSPSPTKPTTGKPRPVLGKRASSCSANAAKGQQPKQPAPVTSPRKATSASASPVKRQPHASKKEGAPNVPANSPVGKGDPHSGAPHPSISPTKASTANGVGRRAVTGPAVMNGNASNSDGSQERLKLANGSPNNVDRDQARGVPDKRATPKQAGGDMPHTNGAAKHVNGVTDSVTNPARKPAKESSPTSGQERARTAHDGFSARRAGAPTTNGTTSSAEDAKSVADTAATVTSGSSEGLDRTEPVKLKRKVPG